MSVDISIDYFNKLDIRIRTITEVYDHPKAKIKRTTTLEELKVKSIERELNKIENE